MNKYFGFLILCLLFIFNDSIAQEDYVTNFSTEEEEQIDALFAEWNNNKTLLALLL